MKMLNTSLAQFKLIAFLEGCSFLLFALSMPLKYFFGYPKPNYFVGMIHGFLFLLYITLLLFVAYKYKWSFSKIAVSFAVAFIPFGTFWADKKVFNEQSKL